MVDYGFGLIVWLSAVCSFSRDSSSLPLLIPRFSSAATWALGVGPPLVLCLGFHNINIYHHHLIISRTSELHQALHNHVQPNQHHLSFPTSSERIFGAITGIEFSYLSRGNGTDGFGFLLSFAYGASFKIVYITCIGFFHLFYLLASCYIDLLNGHSEFWSKQTSKLPLEDMTFGCLCCLCFVISRLSLIPLILPSPWRFSWFPTSVVAVIRRLPL